jgi:hypothetical protein
VSPWIVPYSLLLPALISHLWSVVCIQLPRTWSSTLVNLWSNDNLLLVNSNRIVYL